ncbi:histidine kinase [Prevotella sp. MGM2]|nr:histidine kinase [Prevotella sp. MGM2]
MGERFGVGNLGTVFYVFRKSVQPDYVEADPSGCEIAKYAHHHCDNPHNPQKAIIGLQQSSE